jgi:hypothetical protein
VTAVTEHRPPTILGPYGEGYCKHCRFVLGLDEYGLINNHVRGIGSYGQTQPCKGSGTRPPKQTPYASRSAAFKQVSQKVACPKCHRQVAVLAEGARRYLAWHPLPHTATPCNGGYQTWTPPGRDHGSERG